MSPAPVINGLADGDQTASYVRRVIPACLFENHDTGKVELVPHKVWVFNPDLSIHSVKMIEDLGSTTATEYHSPPNWILSVPVAALINTGAFLKHTPRNDEPVLGPAHHSVYGGSLKPNKTDKANMRDVLMARLEWLSDEPSMPTA